MQTAEFTPDAEGIEARSKIEPFGRATAYEIPAAEPVAFVLYSTGSEAPEVQQAQASSAAAPAAYRPPSSMGAMRTAYNAEVSVRVTNIPLNIGTRELQMLFSQQCPGGCFQRCNLVFDKETRVSKGVAYVGCASKEQAAKFAKQAMNIVIDSCKFCVEILENR
ncbi:hypothetical protein PAPHI01_0072 [Pancytospora philotis]|nr:hypothetical protein PAPHI01_0072 [Pancytospora philotis]